MQELSADVGMYLYKGSGNRREKTAAVKSWSVRKRVFSPPPSFEGQGKRWTVGGTGRGGEEERGEDAICAWDRPSTSYFRASLSLLVRSTSTGSQPARFRALRPLFSLFPGLSWRGSDWSPFSRPLSGERMIVVTSSFSPTRFGQGSHASGRGIPLALARSENLPVVSLFFTFPSSLSFSRPTHGVGLHYSHYEYRVH